MNVTTLEQKYGITFTRPDGGAVKCNKCGAVWAFGLHPGGRRMNGWWRCPEGCNRPSQVDRKIINSEIKRVKTALKPLADEGIFFAGKVACCSTCAFDELEEVERGVFWHAQDRATFGKTGTLYIRFFGMDENDTLAVGRRAAEALTGAGLALEWAGTIKQCIQVLAPAESLG